MSVPLLLEMRQNLSMWIVVWLFAKDFQQIIIYHLWMLGADKVAGESWQLVIAIDVEGDGLILCEWHSEGYDTCSCHLVFGFTGTDSTVTTKSVIVEFLCNLIGICNKIEISVQLWRSPGHFTWYNHWTTLIFEAFNSALLFEVWILWDGTKWDQLCLQTMQKLYGKENEMIFRNNWLHLQFFLMFHCEFLMSLMLW
jgi:hypothetical protein